MTPPSNQTPTYLVIGRIVRPHGIKGQVLVSLETDDPQRFARLARGYLGDTALPVGVQAFQPHKGGVILTLVGVSTRNQAELLRGQWVKIPANEAITLAEDEFFVYQIVGLTVVTPTGTVIGQVQDVLFTGANDVYVVQTPAGELLIPAIADVVHNVDLDTGQIVVTVPPGLTPQ